MSTFNQPISRRDSLLMASGLLCLSAGAIGECVSSKTSAADPAQLAAAVSRMQQLPLQIGDWFGHDQQISIRDQKLVGLQGFVQREYRQQQTGDRVQMTLICGPVGPSFDPARLPGPAARGYQPVSRAVHQSIADPADSTSSATYFRTIYQSAQSGTSKRLRMFQGFSSDGHWQAAENFRVVFRDQPFVYLLVVTDRQLSGDLATIVPQAESFLGDSIRAFKDVLSAAPHSTKSTESQHGTANVEQPAEAKFSV